MKENFEKQFPSMQMVKEIKILFIQSISTLGLYTEAQGLESSDLLWLTPPSLLQSKQKGTMLDSNHWLN